MIEIIKIGSTGITKYVNDLITHIKENTTEFVSIAKVNDGDKNYSFIVLFKDKCVVGKYGALLHEWGTNDGMSGEGGSGFRLMNDFIKENSLKSFTLELSDRDAAAIGYMRKDTLTDEDERMKVWQGYANELLALS